MTVLIISIIGIQNLVTLLIVAIIIRSMVVVVVAIAI